MGKKAGRAFSPVHKILAAAVTVFLLSAQQTPPLTGGNADNATVTFTANTEIVIETVTVRDRNGKPIEGLTAKDFTLTEDGVPQTIQFCDFQKFDQPSPAFATRPADRPKVEAPGAGPEAPPKPKVESATRTALSTETPGDPKFRNRRLLVLYFDLSAMPVPDQLRAFASAQKFIKNQMSPADLMAIMKYDNGAVKVLDDFTEDRDELNKTIDTLVAGEGLGFDEDSADASSADTGSAFGQDDSEFNIFNTDRQLAAIQTAMRMLGSLNEKKSFVYFASGLRLNGINNQAQMQATVNAAIRANVVMFPIDARGLVASSPFGDATRGSAGGSAIYTGASQLAVANNLQQSQDVLYTLAADTGGKALLDYNDLALGIVHAQEAISSYYIIGYHSTKSGTLDGRYRRIRITYNGDPSAKIEYRQGYFAGKVFSKFNATDKERQLEDALMLGDPITELTIDMEIDYFQLNRAEYYVPVAMKIPGNELALAKRGGAEHTVIDFIGEIKDEYNSTITNVRDKVDVKLTGQTAQELQKHPILYETGFTLLPATYTIKLLARDDETGRIGTYMHKFVVP
ncbi:MAG: VWA domain-containing protein, partial [Acidobacteriota bacterium]|nr:VWA domain-containing protein [Acidobacteriota bacterium]